MKSTIEIANLLNDSVTILSDQSKFFESKSLLKKSFHELGVNISFIALHTGLESSQKEIEKKIDEVTNSIADLLQDKQLKSAEDIIKTLTHIRDWVLEYSKALNTPGESYESKLAKIQQLNKEFRAFQYNENLKIGVFGQKEQDEIKAKVIINDSKIDLANGHPKQANGHYQGEASQTVSTRSTNNKKSI